MKVQIIESSGTPQYAVIPFGEWQALLDHLEEYCDMEDLTTAVEN